MLKKVSLIFLAFLAIINFAYSQGGTTASISGRVTDADGKPLAGTTVKVVHQPTGTTAGAVTNNAGRFNIIGLRVGGPYTVTISMVGYESQIKENITLGIDQNYSMNVRLVEKGVKTGTVDVIADKNEIISSNRTGASQSVTESEIKSLPTIARSIHDYSRLSPHIISSTSEGSNVGGRNSKYNNIQVDGAIMSDAFGLSSAGTPGGQAGTEP
ncbi:MAG TPA: carboxypeptidase-like regulatory domain-containing protein, partial [Candidatus Kapabacteria bacterium]|nr:carboxypeptidase-like regulatory domain-containing protein [Candidatus Kapabacteria bacterium]